MQYYKQETNYTCGAAAMRILLLAVGITRTERQVASMLKTNKVRGTWARMFPLVAERFKLEYHVRRGASVRDLEEDLKDHVILTAYYIPEERVDHYVVVKDVTREKVVFLDPWYGPAHEQSLERFEEVWRTDPRYDDEQGWYLAVRKSKRP